MFLETSFCVDLLREQGRGAVGAAGRKLHALGDMPLFVSVFVLCELHAGARVSRDPREELRKLERLVARLSIVYPDRDFPAAYGRMLAHLQHEGTPIPTMDLLIGTMAQTHNLPLLTRDNEHYSLIPGLILESY